jgi:hypothetical protein
MREMAVQELHLQLQVLWLHTLAEGAVVQKM